MSGQVIGVTEKPLAGTVICCTSIAPEVRSLYAEYVLQMGAEHKLDLTSDVTHLLVGETDTPKYKYVAREREDVKVLRPEWVEAVRSKWMEAGEINLQMLDNEHQLPALHGLKICITGFDDLTFRAKLQQAVLEHGGEYTGDLVKDVTHLIAACPEGKKYTYATQWGKKIVSLRWLRDSLDRGMQLEESLYHPSKPSHEQGIGAWNRKPQQEAQPSKRSRDDVDGPEPPRKLRRTASARLGSQSDNLWTDIVAGAGHEINTGPSGLQTSKSMPVTRADLINADQNSPSEAIPINHGYLDGHVFATRGFSQEQALKLRHILTSVGATVFDSVEELRGTQSLETQCKILIASSGTPKDAFATKLEMEQQISVVSEFWLELCMYTKSFVHPNLYPLGSLSHQQKIPGFSQLIINSTGFASVELLHISKMVKQLGAVYQETFSPDVTLLICKAGNVNSQKLRHAKRWGIPAVSEKWLWNCIRQGRKPAAERYLLSLPPEIKDNASSRRAPTSDVLSEEQGIKENHTKKAKSQTIHSDDAAGSARLREQRDAPQAFCVSKQEALASYSVTDLWLQEEDKTSPPLDSPDGEPIPKDIVMLATVDGPLKEISPNSPRKGSVLALKSHKPAVTNLDGNDSLATEDQQGIEHYLAGQNQAKCPDDESTAPALAAVADARALNGEIQELLNLKARARAKARSAGNDASDDKSKKSRLFGRALSNVSHSSAKSAPQLSRASSVDSVNTDGIGSEVAPVQSNHSRGASNHEDGGASLTGRAKSKLLEGSAASIELGGSERWREEFAEEPAAPQLTQLVYDDPEEAIALREKLAAQRRARSRLGQKKGDPKPEIPREPPERRIRDNDIVASAGWRAGRRTRQKDRSHSGIDQL